MKKKPDFSSLRDYWRAPFVSRDKISEFSGGMIRPRTLANLDALGKGPKGRVRVGGKKVAYPVEEMIKWLEARSEIVREGE